jgi:hypothetical protein
VGSTVSSTGPLTVKDDQDQCYVSQDHNNFSELWHAIGSDANCCHSFDSGSDAPFSSKNHDQSNSEKDYHTVFELLSADDCETLGSIENIFTSVEDMFKPFLLDSAISHGVDFNSKMSSEELKIILSDHLCKAGCFPSTYKGCLQVTLVLKANLGDLELKGPY